MDVTVIDLNGDQNQFTGVDRISYTNNESFGPGTPVAPGRTKPEGSDDYIERNDGEEWLVVNVNGFAVMRVTL